MPEAYRAFAAGWQRLHPGWEYKLWGEGGLPPLQNQDLYDRASEFCPGFEGQFRSDILRYELLYQFGGVWIDTDFECRRNIEPLLGDCTCFAAWEVQEVWANNGIMGAIAGHAFIARLVNGLPASVGDQPGKRPAQISGPRYLTPTYRSYAAKHPGSVKLLDQRLIYPYSCTELQRGREPFPDAYAIHHWNNQRRLKRKPL